MESDDSKSSSLRKARLHLLLRDRQGEPKRVHLHNLLERCPSDAWRIVPLSDSDILSANLFSALRSARESGRLIEKTGLSRVGFEMEVRRLLSHRPEGDLVLVALSEVSLIGLLEIRTTALREIVPELIDFDRDSTVMTNQDMSWILVAQRFENGQDVTYQIESWGLDCDAW